MSTFKDGYNAIVNIFSKQFYFLASLASLIGLFLLFVQDTWAVIVALVFFCIMLLFFTISLIYTLLRLINLGSNEFESKSTFVKYETIDGKIIVFENYKLIQAKKTMITEFSFSFKWSGSIMPKVSSDIQTCTNIVDDQDPSKYDSAILKFKKPLYFNENEVIHFKAILDDTDKKSETFVSNRIIQEVDIIHYRIILKYKSDDYDVNAIVERKKINSISTNYEKIKEIAFDSCTKSYEYHLLKPEINYIYRVRWER